MNNKQSKKPAIQQKPIALDSKRANEEHVFSLPHSWPVRSWVPEVYPCTNEKARYMVRVHKRELIESGALVRIGRELVIIGVNFDKWLNKHRIRVPGYEIAPNRVRDDATGSD